METRGLGVPCTVVLNLPLVRSRVTEVSALFHVLCTETSRPAEAKPAGRALAGGRREGGIVDARARGLCLPGAAHSPGGWAGILFHSAWSHDGSLGLRWKMGILQ